MIPPLLSLSSQGQHLASVQLFVALKAKNMYASLRRLLVFQHRKQPPLMMLNSAMVDAERDVGGLPPRPSSNEADKHFWDRCGESGGRADCCTHRDHSGLTSSTIICPPPPSHCSLLIGSQERLPARLPDRAGRQLLVLLEQRSRRPLPALPVQPPCGGTEGPS